MTEIQFSKKELIISIILCLIVFGFILYLFLNSYDFTERFIYGLILILILGFVLKSRIHQYKKYSKGISAIVLNEKGIQNNTQSTTIFINWGDIMTFQTGFYRTREIYIVTKNPEKYERKSFLKLNQKPSLLWIDIDVMDIKRSDLLIILNKHLQANKTV